MRSAWIRTGHGLVVGVLGVVLLFAFGCRKSKTRQEEEAHEAENRLQESEMRRQAGEAGNRQQYEGAKQLIGQRKYDEAWKQFEDVSNRDAKIGFEFELYRSETLPSQLFRVADELAKIKSYQFEAASRKRVNYNFHEAMRTLVFVRDHIEKKRGEAEKKIKYLRKLKAGDDKYWMALQLIEQYKRAEGIRMLEEVRDNYKGTPYYDHAVRKLVELQPPEEGPPR